MILSTDFFGKFGGTLCRRLFRFAQTTLIDSSFGLTTNAFLNPQQAIDFLGVFFVAIDVVTNLLIAIFGLQQLEHLGQIRERFSLHFFSVFKLPIGDQLHGSI